MGVSCCMLWLLLAWVSIISLLSIARRLEPGSKKLPPGPVKYPLIGNLFDLGNKPHKSLAKLAMVHGPIISLKLGQVTTVVISSQSMAKQVLQIHDKFFCDRSIPDSLLAHQHHEFGMPWLPASAEWRNLRKICNSYIFSSKKVEAGQDLRRKKVQELVAYVEESCTRGRAINIGQAAFTTSLNMLSRTIFSVDLADPTSDTAQEFKELVWNIMVDMGQPNLADHFPLLKKIDPQGIRRRMETNFAKMFELFDRFIDQRLKLKDGRNEDMLDILLNITQEIDINCIKHLFLDLFVAGTDTTSSTLEWAMAELILNPEVLSKAQLELEQTIGNRTQVEESDTSSLPYLQAIVKETLRLHPPTPLLLPRKASADIELSGFTIPKDTKVLVNAWAIGRDATTWDSPNSFIPERFLGSDLDFKGQHFELIPFGAGRRICPAVLMAIKMLHLMLASLIHSFDWKLDGEKMNMEDKFGITLQKAQPLCAIPIARRFN